MEPGEPWPTVSKFYVGRVWMFHPAINGYYIAAHLEDCYHDYLGGYEALERSIEMITTDEVLTLLNERNYDYVARDIDGYLYAYKAIPEFEDGYFFGESSLNIDSVDDEFFLYAVEKEKMKELGVLFEEYGEYCDITKEDKDIDFVKFAKEEINHVIELFGRKSRAYGSSDDVFHNFRQTAKRIYGKDTFDNMFLVAETYKDKHNVALAKGIAVPEVDERLRDNIVYSLLQLAMIKAARGESDVS